MFYIIKHIKSEGPGTIADYFSANNVSFKVIELSEGERLPKITDVSGVVVLGGPMNVYEEDKYKFLAAEDDFIKKIIEKDKPYLGICLGAQLLAKAAGSKVYKAKKEEIGWYKLLLTENGKKDKVFGDADDLLNVFQWHGDTFDVPGGGELLVAGDDVVNQAFRLGKNCYGLQFHLEVNKMLLENWFENDKKKASFIDKYLFIKESYDKKFARILDGFLS